MAYKNFKLYLGYKEIPNSSHSQTGITGSWAVTTFNNKSTASYTIALPPGSNYTLVSSNCSSSYSGTFTALLFANTIIFSTGKSGIFSAQQLININASVMSYTISYTAKVGEAYNRIFLGKTISFDTYTYPSTSGRAWNLSTPNYTYTCDVAINNSSSWISAEVSSFTIDINGVILKSCDIVGNLGINKTLRFYFYSADLIKPGILMRIPVSATIAYSIQGESPAQFVLKSDIPLVIDYDKLANNYIDSLSNLSIAASGDNLSVTFTPVTDSVLLNAVDNEDTYIRLQLLVHQPSAYMRKTSTRIPMSYNKPLWIDESDYSTLSEHGQGFPYVRRRSHEARYYGKSWLNLTKAQLQAGSATLSDLSYAICDDGDGNHVENDTVNVQAYNIRVEMFCAALYRKGKDVFYYERVGHKKISNNRTYILT